MSLKSIDRLGSLCLTMLLGIFVFSIPLHCTALAARIELVSIAAGSACGLALAAVTRTRRPALIYLGLIAAAATIWPIMRGWPSADASDVFAWRGAPDIVYNYFDLVRGGGFLLAAPYPFARFGNHAPDTAPAGKLDSQPPGQPEIKDLLG